MNKIKIWWKENRYEICDATQMIACGVAIGLITNSILLYRIKKVTN